VFINISLQCANVAAIIECSQVADSAVIAVFHKTCGMRLYPSFGVECVSTEATSDSPFSANSYYLFTIGFILMMIVVIPLGLLNLDDNIYIQIMANVFLFLITVDFMITFIRHGLDFSSVPFYKGSGQAPVLGVIMANFAFATTVPSWCGEKKKEVSVNKSLWLSTTLSSLVFFLLGYFGALSFKFPADGDVLSVINGSHFANRLTRLLVYVFPVMILATTIPVFSIIVRYNLLQSGVHKIWANLLAVALPWVVAIPLLTGDGLNDVLNWGTLLFSSIPNFIIPFVVYIKAKSFNRKHCELNEHQKQILVRLNLSPVYFGSINEEDESGQYMALPAKFPINPQIIAASILCILSATIVVVIGLNIVIAV